MTESYPRLNKQDTLLRRKQKTIIISTDLKVIIAAKRWVIPTNWW